jgi:hypothetical protein
MTSANDVATWDGSVVTYDGNDVNDIITMGDPKTGTWRPACNEWGNLTLMGEALISASHYGDAIVSYVDGAGAPAVNNSKCPTGLNKKIMEGLTATFTGDPNVLYGGDNDDDDSGCIRYLSLRYGGKVIELQNELNGLSLGAIGRGTEISHVEIMNNVDDGIEIWGGTVDLDHISIWNIGDDSLDIDEGYRGCIEYGIIVQGYCADASQGSGVGDNCFETDGAEDADAQPMTTTRIKYFTVIGQPDGDFGTCWRDNARVQYKSCIWMDLGDDLVGFDNTDGDGANGYDGLESEAPYKSSNWVSTNPIRISSADGTMSWRDTWQTDFATWAGSAWADPRGCEYDPNDLYRFLCCCCEPPAKLAQITNSVFYNVKRYNEADVVGVTSAGGYNGLQAATNVKEPADMPIQKIVRGPQVLPGGKKMEPVILLNPISTADAFTKGAGGFSCGDNWLTDWTAADSYGMIDRSNSDLNCDDDINLFDFAEFAEDWLLI